jgi:hypothetical protein
VVYGTFAGVMSKISIIEALRLIFDTFYVHDGTPKNRVEETMI